MSVLAVCASHTPLKDYYAPPAPVQMEIDGCFERVRQQVADFAPEVILIFGPDHYNGFFYRLMPAFCIGAVTESIGDWNTPKGPLPGDPALAEAAVAHAHRSGVDVAISHRMEVDHGLTQTLQLIHPWETLPKILPVFINCVAAPRPPLARVVALGRALGEFAAGLGQRVLIVGSGGISHDPPVPLLADAAPAVRERLIAGGALSAEARLARQARVIDEGRLQASGESDNVPLNPVWDRAFLAALEAQDFTALSAYTDADISRDGGRGGHEIRCWVAVAAAMAALGAPPPRVELYHAIPAWVAGFAVLTQGPLGT